MWLDIRMVGEEGGGELGGVGRAREPHHHPKVSQCFHKLVLTIAQVMIYSHIQSITLDENVFDI